MDHLREALLHACNPFPQMVAQGLPICSQLLYKKSNLQRLRQPPLENPREMGEKVEHLSSVHAKKVFSFQQLVFSQLPSQNGLSVLFGDHTYLKDDEEDEKRRGITCNINIIEAFDKGLCLLFYMCVFSL